MEYRSPVGWLRQMWVRNESQEGLNGVPVVKVDRTQEVSEVKSQDNG